MIHRGFIEEFITPNRRAGLIATTALVWGLAIGGSFYRFKLAAKQGVAIHLETDPPMVKIAINGQKYFDNAYVITPIKIVLPAGKSQVRISREGYKTHIVNVELDDGDQHREDGIVLEKKAQTLFRRLAVQVEPSDKRLYVEIDDGLNRGETPLFAGDLLAQKNHFVSIYPEWPQRHGMVRCLVTFGGVAESPDPWVVKVKVKKNGRFVFSGCKPTMSKI